MTDYSVATKIEKGFKALREDAKRIADALERLADAYERDNDIKYGRKRIDDDN